MSAHDREPRVCLGPEMLGYVGRVVLKDGINYTVTRQDSVEGIAVWNPSTHKLTIFESVAAFENWAYGTPVPSAQGAGDA